MAEKKQFKAESKRLLDLMINSIYTHKEIFLRELISNASDASDKLYYKALTENISSINRNDLKIMIEIDKENRVLTIKDNGIGMDKDELETHLGTIANSGSFEFKNENEHDDIDIIGQFGVGFYAAFMVAKKVEVISKKYGTEQGYTWVSEVSDGYEIFETNVADHGTTIKLYLKDNTDDDNYDEYLANGEFDTSYSLPGIGRFRVNVFKQRNSDAIAIRVIAPKAPTIDELKLPATLKEIVKEQRGLVLVTGPTGCGKSTTLAAMVNEINSTRQGHIVTLEDPIEYLHKHNKCIVNQREIGKDTKSYQSALRAVLREDPDVILVGEMRDFETISVAITAAETGHLVFSTLHTIGAAKTIERIIDVFPPHQQQQIKIQLASVLKAVVSQQLVETIDGNGRVPSMEIMVTTPGIQNLIREGKTQQIESAVQTGNKYGMRTMDMSLAELCKRGVISQDTAMTYAVDGETLKRLLML